MANIKISQNAASIVTLLSNNETANATSDAYDVEARSAVSIQVVQGSPAVVVTIEGSLDGTNFTAIGSTINTSTIVQVAVPLKWVRVKRDATTETLPKVVLLRTSISAAE